MSKITQNNLEYEYNINNPTRGRAYKYKVITHYNRDRKGGHIHRRWFQTDIMKRYVRVQLRNTEHKQIVEGLNDNEDHLDDLGQIFDYRGNNLSEIYDEQEEIWAGEYDQQIMDDYYDNLALMDEITEFEKAHDVYWFDDHYNDAYIDEYY